VGNANANENELQYVSNIIFKLTFKTTSVNCHPNYGLKSVAIIVTGPSGLKSIYSQKFFISGKMGSKDWEES
jgi:hypothetical protein